MLVKVIENHLNLLYLLKKVLVQLQLMEKILLIILHIHFIEEQL